MGPAQILVVEDETVVALDIQNQLEDLGYSVIASIRSGGEAVQTAGELLPDLILMDIHLQGVMDGISAAACIQECNPIPVIYMTAHGDKETLQRAKMTGPLGYIIKPIEEQDLLAAKASATMRWTSSAITPEGTGVAASPPHAVATVPNTNRLNTIKISFRMLYKLFDKNIL